MKKIKILKILFWIFFVLMIAIALVEIWLFVTGYHGWVLIINTFIFVFFMYLFFVNSPRRSLYRFYDERHIPTLKIPNKLKFKGYEKQRYEFGCGQLVVKIMLENHGIYMNQNELMEFAGDKSYGTSHWEIKDTLNRMFKKYRKPFRARISYHTTYAELEQQIAEERGVIILFMSQFKQEDFTSTATYPHFAILTFISSAEKKAELITPTAPYVSHGESKEGEIILTLSDFHHRFYAHTKHLRQLEYKPTIKDPYTRGYNRFWNLLSRGIMFFAYFTKILKPGIAIIIEPVEE